MKKIIVLIIGLVVVVSLTFYAFNLQKTSKTSGDLALIDFAVQDTAAVDRIDIFDAHMNQTFILKRGDDNIWVDGEGNCVKQEIVHMMLETFLKVTLKGYVPKGALENMEKQMMAKHKKVDIYKNGKWHKTWYVGHPTSDHYGTHMLLETPKHRSDHPVIMGMKGLHGILEPRFVADPKIYRCSKLFSFEREEIKKVKVVNNRHPHESFELHQNKNGIEAFMKGQKVENISRNDALFFLNGFTNIHFNQPNYTLSEADIDSMTSLTPDYQLMVEAKYDDFKMDFYRRPDPEVDSKDSLIYDTDYLWGVKSDGEVVRMQYYVVGPILFGNQIFITDEK